MLEISIFIFWIVCSLLVMALGLQITIQPPVWWEIFGHPIIGFLALLVLPTLFLTLFAWQWFVEADD